MEMTVERQAKVGRFLQEMEMAVERQSKVGRFL
jgi:hypothetical protein